MCKVAQKPLKRSEHHCGTIAKKLLCERVHFQVETESRDDQRLSRKFRTLTNVGLLTTIIPYAALARALAQSENR